MLAFQCLYLYYSSQEELDLSAPNKSAMLSLPNEKKWQIYCSQKMGHKTDSSLSNDPQFYIDKVKELSMVSEKKIEWRHFSGLLIPRPRATTPVGTL